MGAYCSYFYDGIYIDSTKNDIDLSILKLFDEDDIKQIKYSDTPSYIVEHFDIGDIDKEEELFYRCLQLDRSRLLDKLNIHGYTLEFSIKLFNKFLQHKIEELKQPDYDFMKDVLEVLEELNYDKWIDNLKSIRQNQVNRFNYDARYEDEDKLLHYMLTNDWYGYQGFDICALLRLLLEISEDGEFVCDLTDLYSSEYAYDGYISDVKERYYKNDKIIVLTEGKSDIEILSRTLKLIYPHLYEYFAFMDFDGAKVSGGAGPLTGIIKSFAGVGISNKVVAIYDNDTAAKAASKQLERITLPSNIEIMYLPEIERLNNYPTIGPTGETHMNINGMAGSIEMYLGEDALMDESSQSYHPVQWTGYDSGLSQYQGEIIEKGLVQKKYLDVLKTCEENPLKIHDYDFKDIKLVLEEMFGIFHSFEQKVIEQEIEEYC